MSSATTLNRPVTYAGLLLAMFGTPLFLWLLRIDLGDASSLPVYLGREAGIFAMLAVLLLLIRKGVRPLPLSPGSSRNPDCVRSSADPVVVVPEMPEPARGHAHALPGRFHSERLTTSHRQGLSALHLPAHCERWSAAWKAALQLTYSVRWIFGGTYVPARAVP